MIEEKRIAVWGAHLSWDGGIDFLYYLVNGLNAVKEEYNLKIFLILPYDWVSELKFFTIAALNALKRGKFTSFKKQNINDRIRKTFQHSDVEIVYYNYFESDLKRKLGKLNIHVLFPVIKKFNIDISTPWIGYIPDLQHVSLPHFFSDNEKLKRDKRYAALLACSKAVIVNSISVKEELKIYFGTQNNVFNLSFCPPEPDPVFREYIPSDLFKKYNLPKRYFIISNQFWKHKNHGVAFKALKLVLENKTYQNVELFCTGKMQDERFPEYIQELKDYIKDKEELQQKIHFLGFISKEDQMALIDNAVALIQPTLFEGGPGGGSVYNAITLGVPCIVSDIEVNKEISEPNIMFFSAASADDLAEKMCIMLDRFHQKQDIENLIKQGKQRRKQLGEELMQIIKVVADE